MATKLKRKPKDLLAGEPKPGSLPNMLVDGDVVVTCSGMELTVQRTSRRDDYGEMMYRLYDARYSARTSRVGKLLKLWTRDNLVDQGCNMKWGK